MCVCVCVLQRKKGKTGAWPSWVTTCRQDPLASEPTPRAAGCNCNDVTMDSACLAQYTRKPLRLCPCVDPNTHFGVWFLLSQRWSKIQFGNEFSQGALISDVVYLYEFSVEGNTVCVKQSSTVN